MYILDKQDNAFEFNDKELKRLDINYENKAILALSARLYFPYTNDVTASITCHFKDDSQPLIINPVVGTPFPNNYVRVAQIRIGRKKTTSFIPIVFDSLDELYRVNRIEIVWSIKDIEFIIVEYPVKFQKKAQKGVYGLSSYDSPISVMLKEYKEAKFKHENDVIVSDNDSVYDDVCCFLARNNAVKTTFQLHSNKSTLETDQLVTHIVNSVLKSRLHDVIAISYYRTNVELNDECIVVI